MQSFTFSISPDLHASTAFAAYKTGNRRQAKQLCAQIIAQNPQSARALFLYGIIAIEEGHLDVGMLYLRYAREMAPQDKEISDYLTRVEQSAGAVRHLPYVQQYTYDRTQYLDYPKNIQIETTGRCNADCHFCPHEKLERKFVGMTDQLFAKIVNDLKEIPEHLPINIFPNIVNEPFMDKQIFDRLALINRELPRATIGIYTNFNVLPKNFYERIWEVKNLIGINISFNAANKEEYESSMRIDFDRTVYHIRTFMAENHKRGFLTAPLQLSRICDMTESDKRFEPECKALFSEFTYGKDFVAVPKARANWLGQLDKQQTPIPYNLPCMQWVNISIFCTGIVPHCCMDAQGEYAIGDVNRQSVLDVYNSPHFRYLRESLISRQHAYPCSQCSLT